MAFTEDELEMLQKQESRQQKQDDSVAQYAPTEIVPCTSRFPVAISKRRTVQDFDLTEVEVNEALIDEQISEFLLQDEEAFLATMFNSGYGLGVRAREAKKAGIAAGLSGQGKPQTEIEPND